MTIRNLIDLIEVSSTGGFYNPSAVWLHGGPLELEGDALKRYGKSGSDMGALFFCKEEPVGLWYTASYARRLFQAKGKIYKVHLNPPVDSILDLTKAKHRERLMRGLSKDEYRFIFDSRGSSGHADWATVDEELFEPLGFRGCVFQERPKGMETGLPTDSGMATLPKAVLSVGIFQASDAHIIGFIDPDDVWNSFVKK